MSQSRLRGALRAVAVLIAFAAAVDPAVTSDRATKPEVAVLTVNPRADSALAARVVDRLSERFTVIAAPFSSAAATVIVGQHVPDAGHSLAGQVFAVVPSPSDNAVTIEGVQVPSRAVVEARVPVSTTARVHGAKGRQVEVSLLANGSVVDRATRSVSSDDDRLVVPLSFVPTVAGAAVLRVAARVDGRSDTASVDAAIDVRDEKWTVLFFDPRPSWMSTFVRRAVERDPRFAVTSRVNTSTNVSTDAGRPPSSINDAGVMELYDVVVVGAPEALSERDVAGLELFLRRRAGSVVLLFDGNTRGRYERLGDLGEFTATTNAQGTVIAGLDTDSVAMRATEWMWPTRLPEGAITLAWNNVGAPPAARRPMVWTLAAGAGRLVVSGALDAWKFRDPAQSGFEKFWQQTIAEAANASPAAVVLRVPATPVLPGATTEITVTSRSAALAESSDAVVRAAATAWLDLPGGSLDVRLWPGTTPGEFRGTFTAPNGPGKYTVGASADGARTTAPLIVASTVAEPNGRAAEMLAAFAASHGGQAIPASRLAELPDLLKAGIRAEQRRVVWHPMRSAWWMIPFVLALSLEWWLRRRSGLA